MPSNPYHIDQRITLPEGNEATVTFVGERYVGVVLADGRDALWRIDAIERSENAAPAPQLESAPWPESTFVHEPPGERHFMGSHRDPFYEDPQELLGRLERILAEAVLHPAHELDKRKRRRELPASWAQGFHLAWPSEHPALIATCRRNDAKKTLEFATAYPLIPGGARVRLRLDRVRVWESGVEAHIDATLGDAAVTFFDALFLPHRDLYERGREYEFVLAGLAYRAGPAGDVRFAYRPDPDQRAWQRAVAGRRGEPPPESPQEINLAGAAILLLFRAGIATTRSSARR